MATPATISLSFAVPFDGTNLSLTAAVTGDDNNPYIGATITINGDDSSTAIATDNGDGTYSFITSKSTAATVVYVATDGTISSDTITANYTGPLLTTITLANTSFNGTNLTLTATVKDQFNAAFTDGTITINGDDSSTGTATNNGDGTHTFITSKSTAGTVVYTATDGTLSSGTVTVTYTGAPPPTPVLTTITLANTSFTNGTNLTLTATVKDQLNAAFTTGTITITGDDSSTGTATNNGDGTHTFITSKSTAGTVVYTASSGAVTSGTVTVNYTGLVVGYVSLANYSTEFDGANLELAVRVKDQFGVGFVGGTVTINGDDGSSVSNTTDEYGGHIFSITKTTAITVIYTATSGSITSDPVTVVFTGAPPPTPVLTTITLSNTSFTNGTNLTLTATVKDQFDAAFTTGTITISGDDDSSAPATNNGDGTHTFITSKSTAATVVYTATSGSVSSGTVTVIYTGPVLTTITLSNTSFTNGANLTLTATVKDQFDAPFTTGTITISGDDDSSAPATNNDDGTHTFITSKSTAATVVYTATSGAVSSGTVTVIYTGPVLTTITLANTSFTNGANLTLTATVKDQFDAPFTTGTITISGDDDSSAPATNNDDGTHTFITSKSTAATVVYTATSGAVSSGTVTVIYTGPVLTTITLAETSFNGTNLTLTATVKDQFDAPFTTGTITISGDDDSSAPATNNDDGTHTFITSKSTAVTVIYTATSGSVTSGTVTVIYTGPPAPVLTTITLANTAFTDGTNLTLTATVKDQYDAPFTTGTITISGDDDSSAPATNNGDGTHTFTTSKSTAGTVIYTATSGAVTSGTVTVIYTGPPTPVATTIYLLNMTTEFDGVNVDLEVRLKDQFDAPFVGGSVTLNGDDGSSATNTTGAYGSHNFNISKSTAATVIYTGISGSLTSDPVTVVFTGAPPPTPVLTSIVLTQASFDGTNVTLTATVKDQFDAPFTTGTITISGDDDSSAPATNNDDGTHTFTTSNSTAATVIYTATSGAVTSGTVTVIYTGPPAPVLTTITLANTAFTDGTNLTLTATVKDQFDAPFTTGTITISGDDDSSAPATNNGDGTHTFITSKSTAGTVIYTATSGAVTSGTVTVIYTGLVVGYVTLSNNSTNFDGVNVELGVLVKDQFGVGFIEAVTLNGDDGSSLTNITDEYGGHNFIINKTSAITVIYTATSGSVTSDPVTVVFTGPVLTTITLAETSFDGTNVTLTATVKDQFDAPFTTGTITISGDDDSSAPATNNDDGTHTFTTSNSTAVTVVYTASSGSVTSNSVTVTYDGPPPTPVLTSIVLAQTSFDGSNLTLTATVKDQFDAAFAGATITVNGDDNTTGTAQDNNDGTYSFNTIGTGTVVYTATSGSVTSNSVTVTYDPPPTPVLTSIVLTQASDGTNFTLTATVKDQFDAAFSGATIVIIAINGDDNSTGTVTDNNDGTYTFTASGTGTVVYTATSGSVTSNSVTVTYRLVPASIVLAQTSFDGTNLTLTATVTDSNGDAYAGATITINGDDNTSGTATDNNDGTYTFTAIYYGVPIVVYTATDGNITSNSVTVTYGVVPASITLSNTSFAFDGTNVTLTATVTGSDNNPYVGGATITINGDDNSTGTATDNGDGTYTFSTTGTGTVVYTATDGNITSNSVTVTYGSVVPASISLAQTSFDGTNLTLTATVTGSDGNPYIVPNIIILDADNNIIGTATDNNDGTYTFSTTGTGTVIYTATDGTLSSNTITVTYGGGGTPTQAFCVAGGTGQNTIAYSYDGLTWASATNPLDGAVLGIAWNGTLWVAVGYNGVFSVTIATSSDGIEWTTRTSPFSGQYAYGRGIAWNGSLWVAVGSNSDGSVQIASSTDGITWTASDNPFSGGEAYEVAWNGSLWAAVGYNSDSSVTIVTSPDGETWTSRTNTFTQAYGIAWNGSFWVAVGEGSSTIATSPDGIEWTSRANPLDFVNGVAWNGSLWVAVGGTQDNSASIVTSSDGIEWTARTNTFTDAGGQGKGIAWNGSRWVAVGFNGDYSVTIIASSDGITWNNATDMFDNGHAVASRRPLYPPITNTPTEAFCVAGGSGTNSLAYSYNGMTWTDASNNPFTGGGGQGIAWNGSLWVAVGFNGDNTITMATSSDGITWTVRANPFDGNGGNGIAWNGSLWVAVGTGVGQTVTIITSSDGITWTPRTNPFDGGVAYGIAWNGSLWVAVGSNGDSTVTIATSSDGITWTAATSPFNGGVGQGIAWNGSLWVAVGTDYSSDSTVTIATSSDGITWTATTNLFEAGQGNGIAWNGSLWVAVGANSGSTVTILTSPDATTWTARANPFEGNSVSGIAWNGSLWVALGNNTDNTVNIATSPDGITWTARTDMFDFGGTCVASRRPLYPPPTPQFTEAFCVAGGNGPNTIAYSYDGLTWNASTSPFDGTAYGIAWNGSLWLAVGSDGNSTLTIVSSPDGITWTARTNPFDGGVGQGIAWNGSLWVAVGYSPTVSIATSSDGIIWDYTSNPFEGGEGRGIAWNGSLWVAVGNGSATIVTSPDGISWFTSTSPLNSAYGIAWNGLLWVAVGTTSDNTNTIITSSDGTTWTPSNTNPFEGGNAYGIAWNGSLWVAVGYNGNSTVTIATSSDGMTWADASNNPFTDGQGNAIAWNGSLWIAAGSTAYSSVSIATSPDGITWTIATNTLANAYAVASRRPLYPPPTPPTPPVTEAFCVAGGNGPNTIAYSYDGLTWNASTCPFDGEELRGVAWNGSLWVAVGYNPDRTAAIATSPDGIEWTPRTSSLIFGFGVAWNGSLWVAVGTTIATSSDGITWTDASNNPFTSAQVYGIAWNGSLWVAVGYNGDSTVTIATSSDGMTWTASDNPFSGGQGYGIAWNGSLWIAVGYNSDFTVTIASSPDGITWTDASNNPFEGGGVYGIAWNGSLWVAVGSNVDSTVSIITSSDGMTWTDASNNPFEGGGAYGIAWNGSVWVAVGQNTDNTVTIATSPDGMVWTPATDLFNQGVAVASRRPLYPPIAALTEAFCVAGGGGTNTLAYSYNGLSWTAATNPFEGGQGRGIAWNGSLWVAVGFNGDASVTIINSSDGETWTPSDTNPFGTAYGIAWNGSLWVAVGAGTATIATSPDGITWTARTNPFDGGVGQGIAWNGSLWVAVGYNNSYTESILTSSDGITWTARANAFDDGVGQGIAWNGSLWVAVGYNGVFSESIVTSPDGIEWTARTNPFRESYGIAWNGSMWVAVGGNLDSSVTIATSPDGIIWTASDNPFAGGVGIGIAWNGSLWVAVGNNSDLSVTIATSPDGITWTAATDIFDQGYAVASRRPLYPPITNTPTEAFCVAGGSGTNKLAYSYDGLTWDAATSPFIDGQVNGVAWNGSLWVAVAFSTTVTIATSSDGITWTARANPLDGGYVYGVAWNGIWVAVGRNSDQTVTIITSPDGIEWTATTSPFDGGGANGIAWNGSLWVAVGYNTDNTVTIATSSDGITWSDNGNPFEGAGAYGVAWNGSLWVAVGNGTSSIVTSYDGTTWTPSNTNPFEGGQGYAVAWNGLLWVAVGNNGDNTVSIVTSPDGIEWTSRTNPLDYVVLGIAWNGSVWVAVGQNLDQSVTIATSPDGIVWTAATDIFDTGYAVASRRPLYPPPTPPTPPVTEAFCVAGGNGPNTIAYSYDGLTWNGATNPFSEVYGVAWNGSLWIAGGQNSDASVTIATSPDGITWTPRVNPFDGGYVIDIAWNGSLWVAVGHTPDGTTIITSPDGIEWTATTSPFDGAYAFGIAWNGSLWVAVGSSSSASIATSSDGITWDSTYHPFEGGQGNGIAWNGSLWVATGRNSDGTVTIVTSPDGSNWTPRTNPFDGSYAYGIAWNGSLWVAIGYNSDQTVSIITSPDGISWIPRTNPFDGGAAEGIAWNGSVWVAVGANSDNTVTIATSPDGITWSAVTDPFDYGYCVASRRPLYPPIIGVTEAFCVAGAYGTNTLAYSYDGLSWTVATNPFTGGGASVQGVAWNGSLWVAVGYSSVTIATSPDGISWTPRTNPFEGNVGFGIAWNGSLWVAVGANLDATVTIATSDDGIEWTARTNPLDGGAGSGVAWNGSLWVAVGYGTDGTSIVTSSDGIEWTARTNTFNNGSGFGIAWNGSLWVAVGQNSDASVAIATSSDGITWTDASNNPFEGGIGRGIAWNGSLWVAVGANSDSLVTIATSSDGIEWTGLDIFTGGIGYGIAWNGSVWVAVGFNGDPQLQIVTSPDGITWTPTTSPFEGGQGYAVASRRPLYPPIAPPVVTQAFCVAGGYGTNTLAYSYDGLSWDAAANPFDGGYVYGVAWNGSLWVVLGNNSDSTVTITTSTDGITWTPRANPFDGGNGGGVAWNGSYWVAVGSGSTTIATSTDGITWTTRTNSLYQAYGVAWNGSYWISVGYSVDGPVSMVKSSDGITWANVTNNPFDGNYAQGIAWNGSLWVAVGQNSDASVTIATSSDGITWTDASNNPFEGGIGRGIAWNGLIWVAVGYNSLHTVTIATSSDGVTWTTRENPFEGGDGQGITWNGIWVAVGTGSDTIATSPDGITWTPRTNIFPNGNGYCVASRRPLYPPITNTPTEAFCVAGGAGPSILAYSYDGLTWTAVTTPLTDGQVNAVAWNGSLWLAGGQDGTVGALLSSSDGVSWTTVATPFDGNGGSVISGLAWGDIWVAVGDNAISQDKVTIATSTDGTTWIPRTNPLDSNVNGIAWNGSLWVAVGSSTNDITIATSSNGESWTASGNPFSGVYLGVAFGIAWNGSIWVVVGRNFISSVTVARSSDGITWTDASNPFAGEQGNGIAWNGSLWVAVGKGAATIATSTDGATWTARENPFDGGEVFDIAWNGVWVAVGNNSDGTTIATSTDGITWIERTNPLDDGIGYAVASRRPLYPPIVPSSPLRVLLKAIDYIPATVPTPNFSATIPTIAGCVLWLDGADAATITVDSTVTAWDDKSGSSNNATGVGGLTYVDNAVVFDGTGYFTTPYTANPTTETVFIVMKFTTAGGAVIDGSSTVGNREFFLQVDEKFELNSNSIQAGPRGNTTLTTNTIFLYSYTLDTTTTMYYNGLADGNGTTPPFSGGGTTLIGAVNDSSFFNGSISEILIYDTVLSTADRQAVEAYLIDKWGIPIPNPWLDDSGQGNNATIENGTAAKNTAGNGLILDGQTNWTFPDVSLGNAWTAAVWVKYKDSLGSNPSILTQSGANVGMTISFLNGYRGGFYDYYAEWQVGSRIPLEYSQWVNVQVTWDGDNIKTYINGTLLGSVASAGTSVSNSQPFRIGRRFDTADYFVGEIGEVRVYNIPLTQEQVTADYQESLATFPNTPAAPLVLQLKAIDYIVPTPDFTVVRPTLPGCQLWLDGADEATIDNSGSTVIAWNDKSGAGNNTLTVVGTPTYNNGVVFDGTSYFTLPDGTLPYDDSSYSIYVVATFNSDAGYNGIIGGGSNGTNSTLQVFTSGGTLCIAWYNNDLGSGNVTFAPGVRSLVESLYNSGGVRKQFINAGNAGSDTPGVRTQPNIGNVLGLVPGNVQMLGTIHEVLVYNTGHSDTDRQQIEEYLANKWGLQLQGKPWLDESTYGHDATIEDGTALKNADGNGFVLNGSTSWTFPSVGLSENWTVNVWYKNTGPSNGSASLLTQISTGTFPLSLGLNSAYADDDGKINMGAYNGQWNYGTTIQLLRGLWMNFQVTWDGTNLRTYVNGVLLGSVTLTASLMSNGQPFRIGRRFDSPVYMVGEIGEVRIYNTTLTGQQVLTDYQESLATFPNAAPPAPSTQIVFSNASTDFGTSPVTPVITGTVSYTSIDSKDCVYLDCSGTDPQISIPCSFDETSSFTVATWIQMENVREWSVPIAITGTTFRLYLSFDGYYCGMYIGTDNTNYISTTASCLVLTWNHVAVSYASGSFTLTINGNPYTFALPNGTTFSASEIVLGANVVSDYVNNQIGPVVNSWSVYFHQLCIYNTGITAGQVSQVYLQTANNFLFTAPENATIYGLSTRSKTQTSFTAEWQGTGTYTYDLLPNDGSYTESGNTVTFTGLVPGTTYNLSVTSNTTTITLPITTVGLLEPTNQFIMATDNGDAGSSPAVPLPLIDPGYGSIEYTTYNDKDAMYIVSNGYSTKLTIPFIYTHETPFTISGWFSIANNGYWNNILSLNDGTTNILSISIIDTSFAVCSGSQYYGSLGTSGITLPWNQITITYNKTFNIFINGTVVFTLPSYPFSSTQFTIGGNNNYIANQLGSPDCNAYVRQLCFFDTVLSHEQIFYPIHKYTG
jgi:hypothetical protein